MFNRQALQSVYSEFSHIVHDHPGYSALSILASLTNMALNPEYSLISFAPLVLDVMLGIELYNQFKYIKEPPHKLKSQFKTIRDKKFEKYDLLLGELKDHDEYETSLKIFSADPHLKAITQAHFMAPDLSNFHTEYFRYLFLLARFKKGPWFKDPAQQIAEKTRQRGLNLKSFDHLFHFTLQEVYKKTFENNRNAAMNLDKLIAMLTFCENVKGLGKGQGCSTWVSEDQSAHNLDWFTFGGKFPHFLRTVAEPTPHFQKGDSSKPEFRFSFEVVPGFPTSAYNDRGLEINYHEVGGDDFNRENINGGWPGLALVSEIAANCGTLSEAKTFLEINEPASVHNLIILAEDGHGVIESMSINSESTFTVRGENDPSCIATNHHFDQNGNPISESACITGPRKGSEERYAKMKQAAIDEKKPEHIAESAASEDTVATSFREYKKDSQHTLKYNIANASSHIAPGEDAKMHYTTLQLQTFFQALKAQAETTSRQLTREKKDFIQADLLTDNALIQLMQTLHTVGKKYPVLASELSRFYSELNEELTKCKMQQVSGETCMTRESIKEVADATTEIANAILEINHDQAQQLIQKYETLLQQKLPQGNFKLDSTRVVDAFFVGYMSMLFTQMMMNLIQKGPSFIVLEKAGKLFASLLSARQFTATVSALSAVFCLFKKPKLVETGKAVVHALRASPVLHPNRI